MKEDGYMWDFGIQTDRWAEHKRSTFEKINRAEIPLVLFGKSPVIQSDFLERITVPVAYICDNNPQKWGTVQWGLEVIDPNSLPRLYSTYNVLILVPFEAQIVPQLMALPVPPVEIFRLDLYFEEDGTAGYFQGVRAELEELYDCLSDQESKDTYRAVIRYRHDRDPAGLAHISLPRQTQYFPDSLGGKPFLGTEEVYVDAGAFVGDTVAAFCQTVHGQYGAVHAIEPDQSNFERLLSATNALPRVSCYRSAVGDRTGTIRFSSDDSSSRADGQGESTILVAPLDELLRDISVTYLKMDVEGMECAALRGAKGLIQKNHPKLAICTYHSNADMIEIPKLILELDPSYRLYFRHYTNALVETVCYAI